MSPTVAPAARASFQGFLQRLTTAKPKERKLTVGLDIGSTSVKVVALGASKAWGKRPIVGQNLVPVNSEQGSDVPEAIKSAIGTLKLPSRPVNLAVSGPWIIMRVVEMPPMKPAELRQALPFEAQRYLPFNVEDVVLDAAPLGPSETNKVWVLVVACKKELLERRVDWVKRAGYEPALIDVDALALANAFLAGGDGTSPTGLRAVMNVGAQLTNLVVLKDQMPYLVRDVPWGAEKMLRHMADQMGKDAQAVAQELQQGKGGEELQSTLKMTCEGLVTELQLSFDYVENRFGRPPEAIFVTGGLSQSAPFLEALKSHMSQPVTPWTPRSGLSGQFAVAYGLSLRSD